MEENWNDYDFVMQKVKEDGTNLKYASEELRNNFDVVMEAVKRHGPVLQYASEELRNNQQIVIEAIKKKGLSLAYASEELRNNPDFIMKAVKEKGLALAWASEDLKNNPNIVIEAIKSDAFALKLAGEEIINNPEVVMVAVKEEGAFMLKYASEKLLNDPKFMLEAIKEDEKTIEHANINLFSDEYEFFLENLLQQNPTSVYLAVEIVRRNGTALEYVSEELRNNPKVVMRAVEQHGWALQYASEELRNNPDIVMSAVKQHGRALEYAGEELRNNPDIVMSAVKQNGRALEYAGEELRNNPDIVMEAVKENPTALFYASEELYNNAQFIMQVVKEKGIALQFVSEELTNNLDIVMEAIKQDGRALQYASAELCNNPEIVIEAIKKSPRALQQGWINKEMLDNEKVKPVVQEHIMNCQLLQQVEKINILIQERDQQKDNGLEYEEINKQLEKQILKIEDEKSNIRKKINGIDDEKSNSMDFELEERIQYYKDVYEQNKDENSWEVLFRKGNLPNTQKVTIEELNQSEQEYLGKNVCLEVKDASELSLEQLEELEEKYNIVSVQFKDINIGRSYGVDAYDIATYRQCRKKIDELTEGINIEDNEYDKFANIMKRLAHHIEYAYELLALSKNDSTPSWEKRKYKRTLRNLEDGLLNNACVCCGYAEIVRNVFHCIGIEARYVEGSKKNPEEPGHAWNQVKIDGEWYNVDLTWDRDRIVKGEMPQYMLKSDEEFGHEVYNIDKGQDVFFTTTSLPQKQLAECFEGRKKEQTKNDVLQDIVCNVRQSDITKAQENLIAIMEEKNKVYENDKDIDDER